MFRNAPFAVAALAALSLAAPASATTGQSETKPVRGWSAMAGVDTSDLLTEAQSMPLSDVATADQPYCASDAEIGATLAHDFDESLVDTSGVQGMGTELWGSDLMGTWTLLAARDDQTSCIIASGTGFSSDRNSETYYAIAGL